MSKYTRTKPQHPASVYNDKRRILFSQIHKDGHTKTAWKWLEGYKAVLGQRGYDGLRAEIRFYETYGKRYNLTVAGDMGDATDFVGQVDGSLFRIDVTTNTFFKELSTYEPFQMEGHHYKLAAYDLKTDSVELLDINFPFCEQCKSGRIFTVALLLGENYSQSGDSSWSNDQVLVAICGHCGSHTEEDRLSTPGLYDFETYANNLPLSADGEGPPIDRGRELDCYAIEARRFLRREFKRELVAVGGRFYEVTEPRNGDGAWRIGFEFRLPFVSQHLASRYDSDLSL